MRFVAVAIDASNTLPESAVRCCAGRRRPCKRRKHLILSGAHTRRYFLMQQAGFVDRIGKIGKENIVSNLDEARPSVNELLAQGLSRMDLTGLTPVGRRQRPPSIGGLLGFPLGCQYAWTEAWSSHPIGAGLPVSIISMLKPYTTWHIECVL
jgi:hypothetical protein